MGVVGRAQVVDDKDDSTALFFLPKFLEIYRLTCGRINQALLF
jgi:hypothetical protein